MRKRTPSFNAQAFLDSAGLSKKIVEYQRGAVIFSQGDGAASVMYIQQGRVKLSVLSKAGKEAVVAMLGPGDFFGEGCLAGQPLRGSSPQSSRHGLDATVSPVPVGNPGSSDPMGFRIAAGDN